MIKIKKGMREKGVYQIQFPTMLENVKEFSERNKIFYKFSEKGESFHELTD